MWLSLLCVVVVGYVVKELVMRWRYDIHKIPSPPGVPVLGHALHFMEGSRSAMPVYQRVVKWRRELGNPPLMNLRLKDKNYLIVFDAAFTRDVILPKHGGLLKAPSIKEDAANILSGDAKYVCMFATSHTTPYVKAIRRAMARCMNASAMKSSITQIRSVMDKMMKVMDQQCTKGPIDVEDLFTRAALDQIGAIAYETDFGALDNSKENYELIIRCGHHIRNLLLAPFLKLRFKHFPHDARCKQIKKDFKDLVNLWHEIAMHIRKRTDAGDPDTTIWAALKALRHPDTDAPLPIELLRAEVGTMVFGGMDSIGHTLGWTTALLGSSPHVVEKIVDELKAHGLFGPNARSVEFDDLATLEYLTAVVKESMRVGYVNIFGSRKYTDKDMTVLGYRIPKGTYFFIPTPPMMFDDGEWKNPTAFHPERWLSGEDHSAKFYFPFSAGERDCIGQRFAMNVMRFILVHFIANYTFQLRDGETFESLYSTNVSGMVLESRNGIHVHIQRRF